MCTLQHFPQPSLALPWESENALFRLCSQCKNQISSSSLAVKAFERGGLIIISGWFDSTFKGNRWGEKLLAHTAVLGQISDLLKMHHLCLWCRLLPHIQPCKNWSLYGQLPKPFRPVKECWHFDFISSSIWETDSNVWTGLRREQASRQQGHHERRETGGQTTSCRQQRSRSWDAARS